ncbi:MAG: DP-EP family protein [Cellvibrionaceae bacterium]
MTDTNLSYDLKVTFPTPTTGDFVLTQDGNVVSGNISVEQPETVTYTLIDSPNVTFADPVVTDDPNGNITFTFSEDKTQLHITDSDRNTETICIKFVVINPANQKPVVSPDPQYSNIPR